MKLRILLACAASLALAACARPAPPASAPVAGGLTIEKVEADYQDAKAFAALLFPYLPAQRIAQIAELERKIEAAIAVAKAARTLAEQLRALADAHAATAELGSGE